MADKSRLIRPGDLVDVELKNVHLGYMHRNGSVVITEDGGELALPPQATIIRRTPAPPAKWPPQHNDVWRDRDGLNWVAYTNGRGVTGLTSGVGDYEPGAVLANWPPLTLVHREESTS